MRSPWQFGIAAVKRFDEDRGFQTAGSLAFTTLLAIVPIITVALSLASAFPMFDDLVEEVRRLAIEHFLPQTRGVEAIISQISTFRANAAKLTLIGLAFLVVTAVMLMLTVDDVFNRIFRVKRPRGLMRRVSVDTLLLLLGPVLVGGSISMTTFLVGYSLGMVRELDALMQDVLRAIPFIFTFIALVLLYKLVPNRRVATPHAMIGAVLAGVAFEIAKRGFGWYIAQFPTYTVIYGAFAVLPIFLLWIYVSWVVVLGGAIVTALLGEGSAAT
ncbi:MAG: YihY family inner membrane protein [Burkholderiales bacterium]